MGNARKRWPLTAALCGGYFLVLLDVTVVNVALPQIGTTLHADSAGLTWVVDAYSVPLAALLLASGAIGDRLGHRRVVLAGLLGFGAASVLCALAPTVAVLIAGRAVQGVSAALMLPGTLALLAETASGESDRARIVGVWAAVGGAALPAGPVVGGLLVETAGWRAVFWLSVPVIAASLVPVLRRPERRSGAVRAAGVDWAGAGLLVAALACAVTAIIQGRHFPVQAGVMTLGMLGAGAVFWRVERVAAHPLLRVPVAARRPLTAASVVAGLMNLCVLGSLYLLTQVLQGAHGLSPLRAGFATLPAMLPLPLLGAPAGRLIARIGVWRTSALGLLTAAVGFTGIAASLAGPGSLVLLCSLVVWGTGLGILTPAIVTAALHAAPTTPGVASGASNTARQTGGALGVAIFSAAAGDPADPGFAAHSAWPAAGAALVFAITATFCLTLNRRAESAS